MTTAHHASQTHQPGPALFALPMRAPAAAPLIDIIYVEDDDDARDLVADVFAAEGLAVRACATAEEALREAERAPPHVVITDLWLGPGMSGDELARRLKRDHPEGPVVVALSGDTSAKNLPDSPFDLVFIKPVDEAALVDVIRHALAARALGQAGPRGDV